MERIKVLYIAGWGRSGTTILGNILGQIDGFTAVGELQYFWERNIDGHYLCGCGKDVLECAFWSHVLEKAWGPSLPPAKQMIQWRRNLRTRHLPLFAFPGTATRHSRKLATYLGHLSVLYRAIAEASHGDVIVDSSKSPSYAYGLSLLPQIDLSVLLMVRDPRGVAYSWLRPKFDVGGSGTQMKRFGAITSSLLWLTWNSATERLLKRRATRFTTLRYEDFASQPEPSVRKIVSWLELAPRNLPFRDTRTVVLSPTHTTSGNPNRRQTGPIPIRMDERWRSDFPVWRRILVTALTYPMLRRHGYLSSKPKSGATS